MNILPRNTENLDALDLGAGDGRLYKIFQHHHMKFHTYTACDISEKLLKYHPNCTAKIICDLESPLSFSDNSFDLIFSFFVLEHIEKIDQLFNEVERILKPGAKRIVGHFFQRREFVRKKETGKDKNNAHFDPFKIQMIMHRIQDLEKIAKKNLLSTEVIPIHEKGDVIGHILVCAK